MGVRGHAADRRAPTADPELRRLKPGVFLFAAPELPDRNFAETVVLLVQHGPEGALGLVIDRPTELPVTEILGEKSGLQDLRVYWGGPVQPEAMFGLIRTNRPGEQTRKVLDDVYMTGNRVELEAAARDAGADRVRIYLGYAGWGAGQLEKEIRAGGWLLTPGDAASVFSADPEGVWERAYRLLERIEVRGRRPLDQARPARTAFLSSEVSITISARATRSRGEVRKRGSRPAGTAPGPAPRPTQPLRPARFAA